MNTGRRICLLHCLVVIFLGGILLSCGGPTSGSLPEPPGRLQLLGGELVAPERWSGVIAWSRCGAVKFGPQLFLTAAHCVVEDEMFTLKSEFWQGNRLEIATHARRDHRRHVTVLRVAVFANYVEGLLRLHLDPSKNDKDLRDFGYYSDLAVFEVLEPSKDLDAYDIFPELIEQGQRLHVLGWGREVKPKIPGSRDTSGPISDLKSFEITMDKIDESMTTFGFTNKIDAKTMALSHAVLPGDSGAPALIDVNGRAAPMIAGVNSWMSSGAYSHISRLDGANSDCLRHWQKQGSLVDVRETLALSSNHEIPVICPEIPNKIVRPLSPLGPPVP